MAGEAKRNVAQTVHRLGELEKWRGEVCELLEGIKRAMAAQNRQIGRTAGSQVRLDERLRNCEVRQGACIIWRADHDEMRWWQLRRKWRAWRDRRLEEEEHCDPGDMTCFDSAQHDGTDDGQVGHGGLGDDKQC